MKKMYWRNIVFLVLAICGETFCWESCYAAKGPKLIKKTVKVLDADTNGVKLEVRAADNPGNPNYANYEGTAIEIPPAGLISSKTRQPLQKAVVSLTQYSDKSKDKVLVKYPLDGTPVGTMWRVKLGKGILNLPAKITLKATNSELSDVGISDVGQMVIAGYHRRMKHWVYLALPDLNKRDVPNNKVTGELGGLTSDIVYFILVQPKKYHTANLIAAHDNFNNPNSKCLFCHYDPLNPTNLDCIFCHGDRTTEVTLNKKFPPFHYVMLATFLQASKLRPGMVINNDCRVCHEDGVDISPQKSKVGIRINVDREKECDNCHGRVPVIGAPQYYQK